MTPGSTKNVLLGLIAATLKLEASEIDANKPIMELGLDSISAVTMTVQLEEALGVAIDPTVILDYETVNLLSAHLDELVAGAVGRGI
jgi:acyl carrier protein